MKTGRLDIYSEEKDAFSIINTDAEAIAVKWENRNGYPKDIGKYRRILFIS